MNRIAHRLLSVVLPLWLVVQSVAAEDAPATDALDAETVVDEAAEAEAPATDLATELQLLEDVQAGLALALAACAEEAYCVTALNEQEMQHMRDDLDALLAERDMPEDGELRQRFLALLDEQEQMQQSVVQVIADIDRDALDGAWSDQFEIDEIVVGPQVPFPNADVPLSRFEDLNQPLPIE
ncbi:hypothetical protein [Saccharospirillum mangrovi]|uniref:hypothetical protein n=1 Tax=Saccharospirillum mangrovi TaxID=2161747 RepID=UPI001300AA51|nr:hypothetical protein [Saccharospirillum mangrovi]